MPCISLRCEAVSCHASHDVLTDQRRLSAPNSAHCLSTNRFSSLNRTGPQGPSPTLLDPGPTLISLTLSSRARLRLRRRAPGPSAQRPTPVPSLTLSPSILSAEKAQRHSPASSASFTCPRRRRHTPRIHPHFPSHHLYPLLLEHFLFPSFLIHRTLPSVRRHTHTTVAPRHHPAPRRSTHLRRPFNSVSYNQYRLPQPAPTHPHLRFVDTLQTSHARNELLHGWRAQEQLRQAAPELHVRPPWPLTSASC